MQSRENVQITILRSKWSEESGCQSTGAWLRLATSRAEKFDLVAGQTHELALGARKAIQSINNEEQKKKWLEVPFVGIGISKHVKPLVDGRVLTAAVITVTLNKPGGVPRRQWNIPQASTWILPRRSPWRMPETTGGHKN
jgi:hypothetical protein